MSMWGFDPVKARGVDSVIRIDVGGDFSESGLDGQFVDVLEAAIATRG
jgi:hypothetical protein